MCVSGPNAPTRVALHCKNVNVSVLDSQAALDSPPSLSLKTYQGPKRTPSGARDWRKGFPHEEHTSHAWVGTCWTACSDLLAEMFTFRFVALSRCVRLLGWRKSVKQSKATITPKIPKPPQSQCCAWQKWSRAQRIA